MLHLIVLVSAIYQSESATETHISPSSRASLPSPSSSHPSGWSQSTGLSSLCHTANSHQPSILYMKTYILHFTRASHSIHPALSFFHRDHRSVYVCVSIAALQIVSSVPFF